MGYHAKLLLQPSSTTVIEEDEPPDRNLQDDLMPPIDFMEDGGNMQEVSTDLRNMDSVRLDEQHILL